MGHRRHVDPGQAQAWITVTGEPLLEDMLEALADLGYPAHQVTTLHARDRDLGS